MAEQTEGGRPRRFAVKGTLLAGGAAVIVGVMLLVTWHYSGRQSTDDAQVDGHITQIAPRVGGTIVKVHIRENQQVEAGAVLVEIDPRDYDVAVDRARADLADAQANALAATTGVPISEVTATSGVSTASGGLEEAEAAVEGAEQQMQAAQAQLAAAQARQREREATAAKTAKDVERLKALVAKDEVAQQQYDAAVSAAEAARAAADAAQSDVAAAQAAVGAAGQGARRARGAATQAQANVQQARTAPQQVQVTKARADVALARVQQATAALAQAELNLQRTKVTAPTAGVISRKTVEVGQVVQPGQPLMALVNLSEVWITANFKETQLANVRPGQPATIEVDALDGREFKGKVESLAAATGARFSLLPPENATGNYVKVVQRVPVKIALDPGQDPEHRLRPGMSVTPTVFTK